MAALGGLFGMIGGIASAGMAKKEAQRNRDFQERMANTAYQRAMADLRKAGLNPILAAKMGGASTPPGAMAHAPRIDTSGVVGTALKIKRAKQERRNLTKQEEHMNALIATEWAKQSKMGREETLLTASTAHTDLMNKQLFLALPKMELESKIYSSPQGEAFRWMEKLSPFGGTARQLAPLFKRGAK